MGIAAAIGAGIGAAGNILGSATQSAMGYYMSKKMAKYNYNLQKRGYKEFPTAQVQGLRAAGINPMVAYGSIAGAAAHSGNYQAAPGSDLGSSAVNNFRENRKVDPQLENINADTQMKKDQGNAAMMNAKANLLASQANATRANAETKQIQTKTPGETTWGTVDRIVGNAGSGAAALGGSALAAKGAYDILKKPAAVAAGAAGAAGAGAKAASTGAKAASRPGPWKTAGKAAGFGSKALGAIGTALMAHDYMKYFGEESKRQIEAEKKNPEVRKKNEKRNRVYSPYLNMGRRRKR